MLRNFLTLAGCALIAVHVSSNSWAAAGTTAGQFQVGPDGSATYAIPVTVPPGTAGVQPELALQYSSSGGNGVMGVGWDMAGQSQISRCPANLEPDGFIDGVDFDTNDRLCLDGQRLVAVSGTYGNSGAEYRTEIETFSKVVQKGSLNSNSLWFEVWTKSGQIIEYGKQGAYTRLASGKTSAWHVNRISDRSGNYMDFKYRSVGLITKELDRIDYTGRSGVAPYNSVRFEYASRPDTSEGYVSGYKYSLTERLSAVKTYSGENLVRSYALRYEQSGINNLSRLAGLTECAHGQGGQDCLPETTFVWTDFTPSLSAATAALNGSPVLQYSNYHNSQSYIDLNNDGRTDYVWKPKHSADIYASLSVGNTLGTPQLWLTKPPNIFTHSANGWRETYTDVTGDGLPDKVWIPRDRSDIWVAISDGARFTMPKMWLAANAGGIRSYSTDGKSEYYADMNGDGRQDRVWIPQDRSDIWVALSTGTSFDTPEPWLNVNAGGVSNYSDGKLHQRVLDMNADGMADWVWSPNGTTDV